MGFDLLQHLGAPTPFDPTHRYVTSYLIHPLFLAFLRLLVSFYAFFTIFFQLGYEDQSSDPNQRWDARHALSFFTNLCYWGLAFYFLFAGLHGLGYYYSHRRGGSESVWRWLDLERWPRVLQVLHTVFYTSVITFAPLVTIVFWAVIYKGPFFPLTFDAWKNISVHALNTFFALLEIVLPRTSTPPLLHLPFLIILLLLYLALAYLTYATSHFYPYSFLNSSTLGAGTVTGYCVGILAGVCLIFGFVWLLIFSREWIARRFNWEERVLERTESRRSGAQGRAERRSDGEVSGTGVGAPIDDGVYRPGHTRNVSGATAVEDIEMGPQPSSSPHTSASPQSPQSPHSTQSANSPHSPRSPRSPRRGHHGEVIEVDPVTESFMANMGLGSKK